MSVRNLVGYRRLREMEKRAAAAGWELAAPLGVDEAPNGPAIYLCDYESGRLILVLLKAGAFKDIAHLMTRTRFSFQQACNALGSLIDDTVGQGELADDVRAALTLSAAAYVRGTKTYETARGQPHAQFLVVRYRWSGLLRPFAVVRAGSLMSPSELESCVERVVGLDRQAHPDWFPRADVIPFRLREEILR